MANNGWFLLGWGGFTLQVDFFSGVAGNGEEHAGGRDGAIWVFVFDDQ